jgi:hypothetical protein
MPRHTVMSLTAALNQVTNPNADGFSSMISRYLSQGKTSNFLLARGGERRHSAAVLTPGTLLFYSCDWLFISLY